MQSRAEVLFEKLQRTEDILSLIGHTEDVHFDCKEWPSDEGSQQKVFAKAACGLTNAEGGVLVVGMKAKSVAKDEPDVVESAVPIPDIIAVKSRILDLVGQLVEPGIEGIRAQEVPEKKGSKSGFVVILVPASRDGFPRRSRKDSKFYMRIGSGTLTMEYFQIADMFGRRPQPNLELSLEPEEKLGTTPYDKALQQFLSLSLSNIGRGIAKFPSVRYKRSGHGLVLNTFGIDGNCNFGLPQRAAERDWVAFRGGVDDVIYPDTTVTIALLQRRTSGLDQSSLQLVFPATTISFEVACEGMPIKTITHALPEFRHG
jgi:hypothetical protein